jgi:hypothetical protein
MVLVSGLAAAAGCQQTGKDGDAVQSVRQALVGPGLDNRDWNSNQLWTKVGQIVDGTGDASGHGNVAMVNGYLLTIYTTDGGGANASFAFWNVSNATAPSGSRTTRRCRTPSCASRTASASPTATRTRPISSARARPVSRSGTSPTR